LWQPSTGRRFTVVVQFRGEDFTEWTYWMEEHPYGCRLIEEFRMCVDFPWIALACERNALRCVTGEPTSRASIDQSLSRIRGQLEAGMPGSLPTDTATR